MSDHPKRILIVDDDADIVANLADILENIGYQTSTANNGNAALEILNAQCQNRNCTFDLCLLDYRMPGMDGIELFERIRSKSPGLRAIIITAYAGEDGIRRAVAAGTWKVLRKPVDVKQLLSMIDEAIT